MATEKRLAADLMQRYGASMRKACAVIELSRVVYLYQAAARNNTALVMRMKEITQTRVHYGYRRVHVMLVRGRCVEVAIDQVLGRWTDFAQVG